MKFSRYNNPSKRKHYKRVSRADADIIAAKAMLDDRQNGYVLPLSIYDEMSDRLSGNESRGIYNEEKKGDTQ